MIIDIDNEKANSYGLSNVQIGGAIRTALLGEPISPTAKMRTNMM